MGGGKRPKLRVHTCNKCGKQIKSLGWARHQAMHRDKDNEKQQKLT